ncbi:hypothetical protein BT69DRAFT_1285693 [Atractiella rhizophila]|nr:hypothetical protein BT69DRAFT_1285693 [Atractiella rhizophila]
MPPPDRPHTPLSASSRNSSPSLLKLTLPLPRPFHPKQSSVFSTSSAISRGSIRSGRSGREVWETPTEERENMFDELPLEESVSFDVPVPPESQTSTSQSQETHKDGLGLININGVHPSSLKEKEDEDVTAKHAPAPSLPLPLLQHAKDTTTSTSTSLQATRGNITHEPLSAEPEALSSSSLATPSLSHPRSHTPHAHSQHAHFDDPSSPSASHSRPHPHISHSDPHHRLHPAAQRHPDPSTSTAHSHSHFPTHSHQHSPSGQILGGVCPSTAIARTFIGPHIVRLRSNNPSNNLASTLSGGFSQGSSQGNSGSSRPGLHNRFTSDVPSIGGGGHAGREVSGFEEWEDMGASFTAAVNGPAVGTGGLGGTLGLGGFGSGGGAGQGRRRKRAMWEGVSYEIGGREREWERFEVEKMERERLLR